MKYILSGEQFETDFVNMVEALRGAKPSEMPPTPTSSYVLKFGASIAPANKRSGRWMVLAWKAGNRSSLA